LITKNGGLLVDMSKLKEESYHSVEYRGKPHLLHKQDKSTLALYQTLA
jgi:hypothetical protein